MSVFSKKKLGELEIIMAKRRSFSYALLGSVRNKISTPLPFSVHAMGHAMRFFPYMEDLPAREDPFVELYWCISGSGKFYLEDGSEEIMRPGDVFYRLESERHYHEIVEEPWEYRWLTFAGPLAEALLKSYCFPHKCFHAGPCPHELYMRLEKLMRKRNDYGYRESVAVICSILARVGGQEQELLVNPDLVGRAADVCSIYYQDPTFDINTLASILHVNRWTLRRAFRNSLQTTPSEFLQEMRLNNAYKLLRDTHLPISRIARECGFADTSYFGKVIRKLTGSTPSALRRF